MLIRTVVCLVLVGISTAAVASSHESLDQRMAAFAKTVGACLDKKEEGCLRTLVPARFYFPQQREYGCVTADTKQKWYATPEEFARCALTSPKKRTTCGERTSTLMEVMRQCFTDAQTKRAPSRLSFAHPDGSLCHIRETPEKTWVIDSVGCAE